MGRDDTPAERGRVSRFGAFAALCGRTCLTARSRREGCGAGLRARDFDGVYVDVYAIGDGCDYDTPGSSRYA